MDRALIDAYEAWSCHAHEEIARRTTLRRVLRLLMKRSLGESFQRWRDEVMGGKQRRDKGLKAMKRLVHRILKRFSL
jgi:hypothetical protein